MNEFNKRKEASTRKLFRNDVMLSWLVSLWVARSSRDGDSKHESEVPRGLKTLVHLLLSSVPLS